MTQPDYKVLIIASSIDPKGVRTDAPWDVVEKASLSGQTAKSLMEK